MKKFIPASGQPSLSQEQLIVKVGSTTTPSYEEVPMDVLFVGAGPAGLSGAIELAKLVKNDPELGDIDIGILEKASSLGGHCLSGAVFNPVVMRELFPGVDEKDFPFRQPVEGDEVYFLTENHKLRIPTPPTMHNKGNYVASLCEVVRWMGEKAEELGVHVLTEFPGASLLTEGNRVMGVRTTPMGLQRDGRPGSRYMPPNDITAQVTVLTEGTRGLLTQAYLNWQKVCSPRPQIYALGVKELWETKKVPSKVTHTLNWPLPMNTFGGSFMYPMGDNQLSLGLVVGLDYKDHNLDVHKMLQQMKQHPLFAPYLEGGRAVEWGAKTIPEGGLEALPERLHGDGLLMAGDGPGFVNVPALKGIHYAMHTGVLAARTIYKALKSKDTSAQTLKDFDDQVKSSFVFHDLKKVRNMRHAFKSGLILGGIKASLMTLTEGNFPGGGGSHFLEDGAEEKHFVPRAILENPGVALENSGMSKVDAVYLSGNKTRDDIPSHLTVGQDISEEQADLYVHMCPAGVYEKDAQGHLVVNAPNCVDCKATDVLGPRWQPREGGSGPNYRSM